MLNYYLFPSCQYQGRILIVVFIVKLVNYEGKKYCSIMGVKNLSKTQIFQNPFSSYLKENKISINGNYSELVNYEGKEYYSFVEVKDLSKTQIFQNQLSSYLMEK